MDLLLVFAGVANVNVYAHGKSRKSTRPDVENRKQKKSAQTHFAHVQKLIHSAHFTFFLSAEGKMAG